MDGIKRNTSSSPLSHYHIFSHFWLWICCCIAEKNKEKRKRSIQFFIFLPFPISRLVVTKTALGELEHNRPASQSAVDLTVGVQTVVDTTTLLLIEDDLGGLATVLLGADALADDLNGVDQVVEDGVVDSGQSTRARALLVLVGARVDGALGAGENPALSDEEDVAVRELLLELTGQAMVLLVQVFLPVYSIIRAYRNRCSVPLLDLVEALEERDRDEDEDCLLAVADLDL